MNFTRSRRAVLQGATGFTLGMSFEGWDRALGNENGSPKLPREAVSKVRVLADTSILDRLLDDAANAGRVPGVVALAANREGRIYDGAFGKRDLTDGTSMTSDTIFWIASIL